MKNLYIGKMEKKHENASIKSIIFALSANFGIAITKTIAAIITGSSSESIHLQL